MLDPLFQEEFCHAPAGHTVLGRKLHPFSAFDLLTLQAVDSPFARDEDEVVCEIHDLFFAVWLLSNPHSETLSIENLELGEEGEKWVASVMPNLDLERDAALVTRYIRDYFSPPEVLREIKTNPLSALGCPWLLTTVVSVCRNLHIPLREAWTMGIGQLLWYRCSIEEQDTDSRVISPEMRKLMAQAEQGAKVHAMIPGESLACYCARTGIPEADAAFLLHQNTRSKN
jgi:hypothetical protein